MPRIKKSIKRKTVKHKTKKKPTKRNTKKKTKKKSVKRIRISGGNDKYDPCFGLKKGFIGVNSLLRNPWDVKYEKDKCKKDLLGTKTKEITSGLKRLIEEINKLNEDPRSWLYYTSIDFPSIEDKERRLLLKSKPGIKATLGHYLDIPIFDIILLNDANKNKNLEIVKKIYKFVPEEYVLNRIYHNISNEEANEYSTNVILMLLTDPKYEYLLDDEELLSKMIQHGFTEVVSLLLSKPTIIPSFENLRSAILENKVNIVKLLLDDGRVNPDVENPFFYHQGGYIINNKLIYIPVSNNYLEIFKLFLNDPRIDPSYENNSILRFAIRCKNIPIIKLLLKDNRVLAQKEYVTEAEYLLLRNKDLSDNELESLIKNIVNVKNTIPGYKWVDILFQNYEDGYDEAPMYLHYIYHTIILMDNYDKQLYNTKANKFPDKLNRQFNPETKGRVKEQRIIEARKKGYLHLYETVEKLFTIDQLKHVGI